jgi:hypothetical protein
MVVALIGKCIGMPLVCQDGVLRSGYRNYRRLNPNIIMYLIMPKKVGDVTLNRELVEWYDASS